MLANVAKLGLTLRDIKHIFLLAATCGKFLRNNFGRIMRTSIIVASVSGQIAVLCYKDTVFGDFGFRMLDKFI